MSLNLASRPFVNGRPLLRIGVFLWILVGLLALINGFFYFDYFRGSGKETRERFIELQGAIREGNGRLESLKMEISRFDPESQAEHVTFLNQRIAERAFGWGKLFDHLADVLPLRVRLTNLQPRSSDSRNRMQSEGADVQLSLQGLAESSGALLDFIDQLYAHPAFKNPKLNNEHDQEGTVSFNLTVVYVPDAVALESETTDQATDQATDPATDEATDEGVLETTVVDSVALEETSGGEGS